MKEAPAQQSGCCEARRTRVEEGCGCLTEGDRGASARQDRGLGREGATAEQTLILQLTQKWRKRR